MNYSAREFFYDTSFKDYPILEANIFSKLVLGGFLTGATTINGVGTYQIDRRRQTFQIPVENLTPVEAEALVRRTAERFRRNIPPYFMQNYVQPKRNIFQKILSKICQII